MLRALLSEIDAKPLKAFSQNFLIDGNIARKIIQTADITAGQRVLEIGSGAGALTELLIEAGASLTAVEKDRKFAAMLRERFAKIVLFEGDIRDFPLKNLVGGTSKSKVVANLPYHLTSVILGLLLPRYDLFSDLVLMVQKEVAERIVAPPGTRGCSPLSLFSEFYATARIAFHVGRRCFYPVPKVDSSVVHFTLIKRALPFEESAFFNLARTAFQQRRKMLTSSLSTHYEPVLVQKALIAVGLPKEARPEALTLENWISLFTFLSQGGGRS